MTPIRHHSWRNLSRVLLLLSAVVSAVALNGCLPTYSAPPPPQAPGLYSVTGWGGANCWGMSTGNDHGTCNGIDLYGRVGHPFYGNGPTANCVPSRQWSNTMTVSSGSLPPGLNWDNQDNITGIPTEPGHWILEINDNPLTCGGTTYIGFVQEVRIHINGGGPVVQ
jgi:hypothetical protein